MALGGRPICLANTGKGSSLWDRLSKHLSGSEFPLMGGAVAPKYVAGSPASSFRVLSGGLAGAAAGAPGGSAVIGWIPVAISLTSFLIAHSERSPARRDAPQVPATADGEIIAPFLVGDAFTMGGGANTGVAMRLDASLPLAPLPAIGRILNLPDIGPLPTPALTADIGGLIAAGHQAAADFDAPSSGEGILMWNPYRGFLTWSDLQRLKLLEAARPGGTPIPAGATVAQDDSNAAAGGGGKDVVLTREEEVSLTKRMRRGDKAAYNKLVLANLGLVIKTAHRYAGLMEWEDLVQEGNFGLMVAIRKFNPKRGTKLSTYAVWWIRASILKAIPKSQGSVKFGTTNNERRAALGWRRAQRYLMMRGIRVTSEAMAERLGVPVAVVERLRPRMAGRDVSLDAHPRGADGDRTYGDLLPDPAPSPEDLVAKKEEGAKLRRAMKSLDPRRREIVARRHLRQRPAKLRELAEKFDVSRTRIQQLEQGAIRELRLETKRAGARRPKPRKP